MILVVFDREQWALYQDTIYRIRWPDSLVLKDGTHHRSSYAKWPDHFVTLMPFYRDQEQDRNWLASCLSRQGQPVQDKILGLTFEPSYRGFLPQEAPPWPHRFRP